MLQSRKVCIGDLNPHLLCVLCGGYFVDATTIIECLHSFCKTCIVRYLETSKYCPICDVQVHKTKPLQNIRSDQTLQDIVYKLVPGLFQKEMQLRKHFYASHPDVSATSKEDAGEITDNYYFYSADDQVSLSLQYASLHQEYGKRYLRCPAAVTIAHLQKLLRAKHGLSQEHRVDICHESSGQPISSDLTLMDVAYIFQWNRKSSMQFVYQIYDIPTKRRKLNEDITSDNDQAIEMVNDSIKDEVINITKAPVDTLTVLPRSSEEESVGETWKEVQLQISETGVMKVVTPTTLGEETIISSGKVDSPLCTETEQQQSKKVDIATSEIRISSSSNQKVESSDINGNKKEQNIIAACMPSETSTSISCSSSSIVISTNSTSLKNESLIYSKEQKNVRNVLHSTTVMPSTAQEDNRLLKQPVNKDLKRESIPVNPVKSSPTPIMKKPSSSPVGYKTLKLPPKYWNPSVSRGSYLTSHSSLSKSSPTPIAPKQDTEITETSRPASVPVQSKPPRFFKERDRPRFLGNPVSGVKPMYQIQSDIPSRRNAVTPPGSSSMIKIDPKTLSPMTSKAPITCNVNNNNHLSCNSVTTGTITTTTANSKFISKSSTSVPTLSPVPPVLHPPPNPLMYNFPGLMNSPLMRPPIIPSNAPHHFPPYPLPQPMFYGSQFPRFPHTLPTVQRVPANVYPQKSPTPPIPVSTSHNLEIPKVNGESAEKSAKNEMTEKLGEVAKPHTNSIPPIVSNGSNSDTANKLSNCSSNNSTSESSNQQTSLKVKSVDNYEKCTINPEPSKSVPPTASPAQNTS